MGESVSEPKEILNVDEAAALLGVHRQTVYDYASAGEIPHRRLGRRLLFSRRAIVAWVEGKAA
jgi:excisionase family DNA binding protein